MPSVSWLLLLFSWIIKSITNKTIKQYLMKASFSVNGGALTTFPAYFPSPAPNHLFKVDLVDAQTNTVKTGSQSNDVIRNNYQRVTFCDNTEFSVLHICNETTIEWFHYYCFVGLQKISWNTLGRVQRVHNESNLPQWFVSHTNKIVHTKTISNWKSWKFIWMSCCVSFGDRTCMQCTPDKCSTLCAIPASLIFHIHLQISPVPLFKPSAEMRSYLEYASCGPCGDFDGSGDGPTDADGNGVPTVNQMFDEFQLFGYVWYG